MSIKESTIKKIREIPISEILIGEGIEFKRIGRELLTICPWHTDTNPSLTVNDDKNICFCFACGGGTDGIAYVQQKFGLNFVDAVQRIADLSSITVEHDDLDPEESLRFAVERKRLIDEVKKTNLRFRDGIRSDAGEIARQWLLKRGIKPEASRHFEIGWAKDGYFEGRVVIPIHDHRGTIVGFTGRKVSNDDHQQKYKNSQSSQLFDKGSLLFNEHRASESARRAGYIIFVEGHFDVITMWQHGIENVVATQGTAGPSVESVKRLMRQCRRFVLCYDGDDGGRKAIEHFLRVAGPLACQGEITITICQLPDGSDPDDCIRNGIDLHTIIESAPQWLDWQIDCWLRNIDRSDTHRFSSIEKAIRELVESIKSPALRQYYVDKAAKVLAEDGKSAARLAKSWNKSLPKLSHNGKWTKPTPSWLRTQVERRALRSYIHIPETRQKIKPLMKRLTGPSHIWLWNRICELEMYSDSLDPSMVMSILAVCEPHYARTLRAIAVPTIKVLEEDGIIDHAELVLSASIETDG